MKLYASNELKSRLTHAAANGSVIAADILSELKKNRPAQEIIRGSYNFLSTKRKWTDCGSFRKIRIVFTAFNKDPEHPNFPDRNNPQAPWFPENRTDLNHPPSSNSSRTCGNTHPARSVISAAPSRSTAKFPSGCIRE